MFRTKKMYILAAGLSVFAIAAGVGVAIASSMNGLSPESVKPTAPSGAPISASNNTQETEYYLDDEDWATTVMYDGKTYKLRDDIKTILFMGVDSDVSINENDITGGGGRADTVLLFVIDETNNTMDILEISRETIVDVDVYNTDRDYMYTGPMQLCLQYSFSDTSKRGCLLMKDKVANLLYGIKIDNYCSLTVNGMVDIVEEMGGITLTFDEDFSYLSDEYVIGNTVTLDGKEVEKFIRYRDIEVLDSNNTRMDRQAWFMKELFDQMSGRGTANLIELYDAAGNHLCTDMSADEIKSMANVTLGTITKAPGEVKQGNAHAEFYVDDEALRKIVIDLLYEEA